VTENLKNFVKFFGNKTRPKLDLKPYLMLSWLGRDGKLYSPIDRCLGTFQLAGTEWDQFVKRSDLELCAGPSCL